MGNSTGRGSPVKREHPDIDSESPLPKLMRTMAQNAGLSPAAALAQAQAQATSSPKSFPSLADPSSLASPRPGTPSRARSPIVSLPQQLQAHLHAQHTALQASQNAAVAAHAPVESTPLRAPSLPKSPHTASHVNTMVPPQQICPKTRAPPTPTQLAASTAALGRLFPAGASSMSAKVNVNGK